MMVALSAGLFYACVLCELVPILLLCERALGFTIPSCGQRRWRRAMCCMWVRWGAATCVWATM